MHCVIYIHPETEGFSPNVTQVKHLSFIQSSDAAPQRALSYVLQLT